MERLFNIARDICFYRRYNLKPDTIRALIISIYIDYYLLCENLQIIKASNNIKEEVLLEINNNKLKKIKIHKLINNNKEGLNINFKKKNNLPLLPR